MPDTNFGKTSGDRAENVAEFIVKGIEEGWGEYDVSQLIRQMAIR